MSSTSDSQVEHKIIDPLLAFRRKVEPLNQIHNDCMQVFTTTIMGLLTGSDGGVEFQGAGANALAEIVGQFLNIERQLAGTDPFSLEGRLQDASVICERYASLLQEAMGKRSSSHASAHFTKLGAAIALDGGEGQDENDGDPNQDAFGFELDFQADMVGPINEPLPDPPDINAMPATQAADPSLGPNAGFIQTLGIDPAEINADITSSNDGGLGSDGTEGSDNTPVDRSIGNLQNTGNFRPSALHHIFEGDLRGTNAGGFHYEGVPGAGGSIIPGTETPPNAYGVYEAQVEVNGVEKEGISTFFPQSMSPQEVVNSINEAYNTRTFVRGNTYVGTTSTGMRIYMFLDRTGHIISAFPAYP